MAESFTIKSVTFLKKKIEEFSFYVNFNKRGMCVEVVGVQAKQKKSKKTIKFQEE